LHATTRNHVSSELCRVWWHEQRPIRMLLLDDILWSRDLNGAFWLVGIVGPNEDDIQNRFWLIDWWRRHLRNVLDDILWSRDLNGAFWLVGIVGCHGRRHSESFLIDWLMKTTFKKWGRNWFCGGRGRKPVLGGCWPGPARPPCSGGGGNTPLWGGGCPPFLKVYLSIYDMVWVMN